ncbi:MAG: IPT/TIG domain-containing protein, partial [Pseudomonadota bacterium]|nr:IPT/TIG domain-containing protein [Pseudomonadota bacterium]
MANNSVVTVVANEQRTPGAGDVIIVSNTGSVITEVDGWTYFDSGEIISITPAIGQQGTQVVIEGSTLLGGGSAIVSVTICGIAATVTNSNDTEVRAIVGPNTPQTGDVVLNAETGAVIAASGIFTYGNESSIEAVTPNFGQEGTIVRISGFHLRGHATRVSRVNLASVPATIINESDSIVWVEASAYSGATTGDIEVIADSGAIAILNRGWNYRAPGRIDTVSPDFGHNGTRVRITGSDLRGHGESISQVLLAGREARIISQGNTAVVVVATEGPVDGGTGAVSLRSSSGAIVASDSTAWRYEPSGVITRVVPSSGQVGTNLVISGRGMCGGGTEIESVTLGGVEMVIDDSSSCDVILGVAQSFNTQVNIQTDVVITSTTGAVVTETNGWTYRVRGAIDSVEPAAGGSGTLVTISGVNVLGGGESATVTLNGTSATVIEASATRIVARANPGDGIGQVIVTA